MTPDFIIKVCGITNVDDARAALNAGANALGFNFYPESPRYIQPQSAAEIIHAVDGSYLRVGLFVNASEAHVQLTASHIGLDVVQLHGSTPLASGLRNWQATQVTPYPVSCAGIEAFLLDTFTPDYGGSGKTFDWSLATGFPYHAIIAGGLDAQNVADAIRVAEPWGVDACSRLEAQPGRKDPKRVDAFVSAALAAFHAQQEVHS